jgi:hypothetical protein
LGGNAAAGAASAGLISASFFVGKPKKPARGIAISSEPESRFIYNRLYNDRFGRNIAGFRWSTDCTEEIDSRQLTTESDDVLQS